MPRTGYGINIPLTPQTYNVPDYEYREYPKAMNITVDKDYVEAWKARNSYFDPNTNKTTYTAASPRIGSKREVLTTQEMIEAGIGKIIGQPLTVNNANEEQLALKMLGLNVEGPAAKKATVQLIPEDDELEKLRRENQALKARQEHKAEEAPARSRTRRNRNKTKLVSDVPA